MEFIEEIKKAKEQSKKRKFTQTWDIAISLKNIDLKKPENKLNLEFSLPEGKGRETKNVFIVDTLLPEAKGKADLVITKNDLDKLGKDKKMIKAYSKEYEWWFAEAPLMPQVGKTLGIVLGPRGLMPKPIPPKGKIDPFIIMSKKLVRVRIKDSPVIHVSLGTEEMKDEQIAKNLTALMNFVNEKLPKGRNNVKNAYIKLTMGKPVRLKI
ncbi:MAG: 50S ribosomal protein L1 [Candidatus Aenigmarchaeota archaeon]|nr:50S ribosomal protein L1 [Candidatus Aenigmarchaeota archaeon]